jgi:hypothetical protein
LDEEAHRVTRLTGEIEVAKTNYGSSEKDGTERESDSRPAPRSRVEGAASFENNVGYSLSEADVRLLSQRLLDPFLYLAR